MSWLRDFMGFTPLSYLNLFGTKGFVVDVVVVVYATADYDPHKSHFSTKPQGFW
jgi:hypothetical protein